MKTVGGDMLKRELGRTGRQASILGLGTFAIGGWFWGGTDEKKSIEAIHASLDRGVTLIDTAPIYGFGLAEQIVGKALKGRRSGVILATKCGLRWDTDKGQFDGYADEKGPSRTPAKYEIRRCLAPESIRHEVEQSLRRLNIDVIDLYQTHWQESTTPIEVTMETLLALQREGKIRAIGVSNVNVEQLRRYGTVASAQEKFSLLDRKIEQNGLVDHCADQRISILSYFTLEQGLLTGAMRPGRAFPEGDTRKGNPLFGAQTITRVNAILSDLLPFAEKYRATLPQIVIALTARQPGITHVLVGARDAAQARENAGGGCLDLSAEDVREMNGIVGRLETARD
jgi:aryl-alcohol dehydrogenase-like predicted oxidoreductase